LPIIAGDKIQSIFGRCLWNYIEWEKQVMANAIFEIVDPEALHAESEELASAFRWLKGRLY
jgi:hypothetical protein